jgi:hypothetical protein
MVKISTLSFATRRMALLQHGDAPCFNIPVAAYVTFSQFGDATM